LIIDLRGNPGGLLPAAVSVCDALLDEGLIVTTRGRNGVLLEQHQAERGTDLPATIPIVVLVDRLSASASEIVAACLQDHGRAAVAGQRSWGKGSVQNVISLEGGKSALRLTIGSYRRPSGKEIHKWKKAKEEDDWGVRPDAGLEATLTNHQNDLLVLARRQRDLTPWEKLAAEPAKTNSSADPQAIPTPQPDAEGQVAEKSSSLETEAASAAKQDPAAIDPQLQKALEYLQNKINQPAPEPNRA
jgi:carboxyl-terminal processing protease